MNAPVYFAMLVPQPSSMWMLPFACIALSIVYGVITHRMDMMLGAAFVLCFYTAGHLYLPTFFEQASHQKELVMTMHVWFSCIASYMLLLLMFLALLKDAIVWTWRRLRPKPSPKTTTRRPKPATKATAKKVPTKPPTLNELAAKKKTAPKGAVAQKPRRA